VIVGKRQPQRTAINYGAQHLAPMSTIGSKYYPYFHQETTPLLAFSPTSLTQTSAKRADIEIYNHSQIYAVSNHSFAKKINTFNKNLHFEGTLPPSIGIMNPFKNEKVYDTACSFYNKYYSDHNRRKLILGINPGRLGAGATGIPFTDPKRLIEICKLPFDGPLLHEPSSVFIYDVIAAFGGPELFYAEFYIHSVCPLGFVIRDKDGKEKNYNYYDSKPLQIAVKDFIEWNIGEQIRMGCFTDVAYCLGTGQNYRYLLELNNRLGFFGKIIPLEHPRYVMQYKSKDKEKYIADYLQKLGGISDL
jgi:hypothetical protein